MRKSADERGVVVQAGLQGFIDRGALAGFYLDETGEDRIGLLSRGRFRGVSGLARCGLAAYGTRREVVCREQHHRVSVLPCDGLGADRAVGVGLRRGERVCIALLACGRLASDDRVCVALRAVERRRVTGGACRRLADVARLACGGLVPYGRVRVALRAVERRGVAGGACHGFRVVAGLTGRRLVPDGGVGVSLRGGE